MFAGRLIILTLLVMATRVDAAPIHGFVYADSNRDGLPSAGERGIPGVIVGCNSEWSIIFASSS